MTTICPRCFTSESMRVVGAYVYSVQGAEDSADFKIEQFNLKTALVSLKLYQCKRCQAHVPETEVARSKELISKVIFWETNSQGGKVPVVCPRCKNAVGFLRKSLVLSEQEQPVQVVSAKELRDDEGLQNRVVREQVPLSYRCMAEGCSGEIVVNEDDYFITKHLSSGS